MRQYLILKGDLMMKKTVFSVICLALCATMAFSSCAKKDEETNNDVKNEEPIRFSIYDRIGGGDAFASGVIHGLIKDYNNPDYALKFGLATAILKHTLYGDVSTLSEKEINEFIESNGDASVQR